MLTGPGGHRVLRGAACHHQGLPGLRREGGGVRHLHVGPGRGAWGHGLQRQRGVVVAASDSGQHCWAKVGWGVGNHRRHAYMSMNTRAMHAHVRVRVRQLRLALALIFRLLPGGYVHLAPVCSSWVFLSRGSTLRSPALPEGQEAAWGVAAGNQQCARRDPPCATNTQRCATNTETKTATPTLQIDQGALESQRCALLVSMAAALRHAVWTLEQPMTSVMVHYDKFQWLLTRGNAGCFVCNE